jgi:hypothetical protein
MQPTIFIVIGQFDDLRRKWFQVKTCQDGSNGSAAIEIESLGGLFINFTVISILSIFLFIWHNRYIIKNDLSNLYRRRNKPAGGVIYMTLNSIKICTDSLALQS